MADQNFHLKDTPLNTLVVELCEPVTSAKYASPPLAVALAHFGPVVVAPGLRDVGQQVGQAYLQAGRVDDHG